MGIKVKNKTHHELVDWLESHVGRVLWKRPIVQWRGEGWCMENDISAYDVTIDNEKLAILFALKWA